MTDPDGAHSEQVLAEALRVMAGEDLRVGPPAPQRRTAGRMALTTTQMILLAVLIGLILGIVSGLLLS